MSLEQEVKELQAQTKCPLADCKIFVFAQPMDPYNRRYIVLECPAKRRTVSNPVEWKVYEEDIRKLCCAPDFAEKCEWYKKVR